MRKYKRFKRWVFTAKLGVPPKTNKDRVEERVGSATPHPQPQAAVKMLETPITHRSLSLTCSCDTRMVTPTRFRIPLGTVKR